MSTAKKYDAIVVGSGATGGFAAKELAERGLETLVLEAGPALDEELFHKGAGMKAIGSISRVRAAILGQHIQARASFFSPDKRFLFVNDWKNPYTCPPDDFYLWIRGRNVGGRFLSWGRVALRMSDYDFKAASRDGIGEDWPICYDDLVPYYERGGENFSASSARRTGSATCPTASTWPKRASDASRRDSRKPSRPSGPSAR